MKFKTFNKKIKPNWNWNEILPFNFKVVTFCDKGVKIQFEGKNYAINDFRKYWKREEITKGEIVEATITKLAAPGCPTGKYFIKEKEMVHKIKPSILKEMREKVKPHKSYSYLKIKSGAVLSIVPCNEGDLFFQRDYHWVNGRAVTCPGNCDYCVDFKLNTQWKMFCLHEGKVKIINIPTKLLEKINLMIEDLGEEDFMPPTYREFKITFDETKRFSEYFVEPMSVRELSESEKRSVNNSHSIKDLRR